MNQKKPKVWCQLLNCLSSEEKYRYSCCFANEMKPSDSYNQARITVLHIQLLIFSSSWHSVCNKYVDMLRYLLLYMLINLQNNRFSVRTEPVSPLARVAVEHRAEFRRRDSFDSGEGG